MEGKEDTGQRARRKDWATIRVRTLSLSSSHTHTHTYAHTYINHYRSHLFFVIARVLFVPTFHLSPAPKQNRRLVAAHSDQVIFVSIAMRCEKKG
jgi:hypothetical protein